MLVFSSISPSTPKNTKKGQSGKDEGKRLRKLYEPKLPRIPTIGLLMKRTEIRHAVGAIHLWQLLESIEDRRNSNRIRIHLESRTPCTGLALNKTSSQVKQSPVRPFA